MANTDFLNYEKVMLFGDSITELSFDQTRGFGSGAALKHLYRRKLDIVERGFCGYNTSQALAVLPRIVPPIGHSVIRLMIISFGTNDAVLEGQLQHCPLPAFIKNLRSIVEYPLLKEHGTKFILITPAPICEYKTQVDGVRRGKTGIERLAENTSKYAEAVLKTAADLGIPSINLWAKFMKYCGWEKDQPLVGSKDAPESEKLGDLLIDGLHFTPEAYRILFESIVEKITECYPELGPEAVPYLFPPYDVAPFSNS